MKRISILFSTLILFGGFSSAIRCFTGTDNHVPCERTFRNGKKTIVFIYPNCGDTSTYLKQTFDGLTIQKEECYKRSQIYFQTSNFQRNGSDIAYDEFLYLNGRLFEVREQRKGPYRIWTRALILNDSTTFNIKYHSNGRIQSYGIAKNGCASGRMVESDSTGKFKWIGKIEPIETEDSVYVKNNQRDSDLVYIRSCGVKTGTWTKYDLQHNRIDSIIYIDGKPKTTANSR